jgi:hypothetical protein
VRSLARLVLVLVGIAGAAQIAFAQSPPAIPMPDISSTDGVVLGEVGVAIAIDAKWSVVPSYRFEAVLTQNGHSPNNENIFKLGIRYSP